MADNNISCELNKKGPTITKETIEGLKDTVRNLYLADDIPWVIGYSGGKDSTATLQLVWLAIEELPAEQLKNAKKIHVINTDTMVECATVFKSDFQYSESGFDWNYDIKGRDCSNDSSMEDGKREYHKRKIDC